MRRSLCGRDVLVIDEYFQQSQCTEGGMNAISPMVVVDDEDVAALRQKHGTPSKEAPAPPPPSSNTSRPAPSSLHGLLIERNAQPIKRDSSDALMIDLFKAVKEGNREALRQAVETPKKAELVKTWRNQGSQNILHAAVWPGENNMELVRYIVADLKMDVNATDEAGWTPLHLACHSGLFQIADYLISRGSLVFALSSSNTTPLHYLLRYQPFDIKADFFDSRLRTIRLLLEEGADVNALTDLHISPLHELCKNATDLKALEALVSNGAIVNQKNESLQTPLFHLSTRAQSQQVQACITYLLSNGADPFIPDKSGRRPIEMLERLETKEPALQKVLAKFQSSQDPLQEVQKQKEETTEKNPTRNLSFSSSSSSVADSFLDDVEENEDPVKSQPKKKPVRMIKRKKSDGDECNHSADAQPSDTVIDHFSGTINDKPVILQVWGKKITLKDPQLEDPLENIRFEHIVQIAHSDPLIEIHFVNEETSVVSVSVGDDFEPCVNLLMYLRSQAERMELDDIRSISIQWSKGWIKYPDQSCDFENLFNDCIESVQSDPFIRPFSCSSAPPALFQEEENDSKETESNPQPPSKLSGYLTFSFVSTYNPSTQQKQVWEFQRIADLHYNAEDRKLLITDNSSDCGEIFDLSPQHFHHINVQWKLIKSLPSQERILVIGSNFQLGLKLVQHLSDTEEYLVRGIAFNTKCPFDSLVVPVPQIPESTIQQLKAKGVEWITVELPSATPGILEHLSDCQYIIIIPSFESMNEGLDMTDDIIQKASRMRSLKHIIRFSLIGAEGVKRKRRRSGSSTQLKSPSRTSPPFSRVPMATTDPSHLFSAAQREAKSCKSVTSDQMGQFAGNQKQENRSRTLSSNSKTNPQPSRLTALQPRLTNPPSPSKPSEPSSSSNTTSTAASHCKRKSAPLNSPSRMIKSPRGDASDFPKGPPRSVTPPPAPTSPTRSPESDFDHDSRNEGENERYSAARRTGNGDNSATELRTYMLGQTHHSREIKWSNSEISHTIIRLTLTMEFMHRASIVEQGLFISSLESTAEIAWVDLKDVVEITMIIIKNYQDHNGKTYNITGVECLSCTDLSKHISEIINRKITFISITPSEYHQLLLYERVPHDFVVQLVELLDVANEDAHCNIVASTVFSRVTADGRRLLGKDMCRIRDHLDNNRHSFLPKEFHSFLRREREMLFEQFVLLDSTQTRKLSPEIFSATMSRYFGKGLSGLLFNAFDFDADGFISFGDFHNAISIITRGNLDQQAAFAFCMFDQQKQGRLSWKNIETVAKALEAACDIFGVKYTPFNTISSPERRSIHAAKDQKGEYVVDLSMMFRNLFDSMDNLSNGSVTFEQFKESFRLNRKYLQSLGIQASSYNEGPTFKPLQASGYPVVFGHEQFDTVIHIILGISESLRALNSSQSALTMEEEYQVTHQFDISLRTPANNQQSAFPFSILNRFRVSFSTSMSSNQMESLTSPSPLPATTSSSSGPSISSTYSDLPHVAPSKSSSDGSTSKDSPFGSSSSSMFSGGEPQNGPVMVEGNDKWQFMDVAPRVFREIRKEFGIDEEEFRLAFSSHRILGSLMSGNFHTLLQVTSSGRSNSIFFRSPDNAFYLKTIPNEEEALLRRLLPRYHRHVCTNKDTLLPRIFGLYRIRGGPLNQFMHFIVMANLFDNPNVTIHELYDLKGSTVNRSVKVDDTSRSFVAQKDNDLHRPIHVGPSAKALLLQQIERDVRLLEEFNICDYSLLVGFHYIDTSMQNEGLGSSSSSSSSGSAPSSTSSSLTSALKGENKGLRTSLEFQQRRSLIGQKSQGREEMKIHEEAFDRLEVYGRPDTSMFRQYRRGLLQQTELPQEMYFIGLIDILTEYDFRKKGEHFTKSIFFGSSEISAISPIPYRKRFLRYVSSITK